MAIPHPRRPAGVSRMLRAQRSSSPSPPTWKALLEADDWEALSQRAQEQLDSDSSEMVARFKDHTWPRLLRQALTDKRMRSFYALATPLLLRGQPLELPPQTISWMLKAAEQVPDLWSFDTPRPHWFHAFTWALTLSPQDLSNQDWLRHAAQGMPLISPEHDVSRTSWYQKSWQQFFSSASNQHKLVDILLSTDPQASYLGPLHTAIAPNKGLNGLTQEQQEAFGWRLSEGVLTRLKLTQDPLTVRGLAQWVFQLRKVNLATGHPVASALAQRLCECPTIPSNASHQTGAWGLLYRLAIANPALGAPDALVDLWTPEVAQSFGTVLGQAAWQCIMRTAAYGDFSDERWQSHAQAVLAEICQLEQAMINWGLQGHDHQVAYRDGIEQHCPTFEGHLQGVPLPFGEDDSRITWQRVHGPMLDAWHARSRSLSLEQALPPPLRSSPKGPRF